MSKLDELISELCPNNVEYKKVSDLCNISRGVVISKQYIEDNKGSYPVYSSQTENNGKLGRINSYRYNGEYLTWTTDGANAGSVFYRNGKFSVTNVCGLLEKKISILNLKFLYYVLTIEAPKHVNRGMGNPKLMSNVMSNINIPVPPRPIQDKIVCILDNFTGLTEELTTELTSELTARKQQYEYYRDKLLTFDVDIPTISLKEVIKHRCSGATPQKSNPEYYDGGTIPWIRTQDVCFNEITKVDSYITETAVKETAAKWIPENCVIVAISGATAGRCAINKIRATTNQHCLNMEIDENKALYKYVYYCLCSKQDELISKKQGARGDLTASLILETKIPVPDFSTQKKIVDVLNNFESIYSNLVIELLAEIELRQKQYEYYRDKLLSF